MLHHPLPLANATDSNMQSLLLSLPADARVELASKAVEMGLPCPQDEEWRFTPITRQILGLDLNAATPRTETHCDPSFAPLFFDQIQKKEAEMICCVDGIPATGSSLQQDGLKVEVRPTRLTTEDAPEDICDVFGLLNRALNTELVIEVEPGANVSTPLHLIHATVTNNLARYSRVTVFVGKGAHFTLVESHVSKPETTGGHSNSEILVHLDADAHMNHYRWFDQPEGGVHVNGICLNLGIKANYEGFTLTKSESGMTRHNINAKLGDSASCRLDGAWLLDGDTHCDTCSFIDHAKPGGESKQTQKGVIGGAAHGVFQGKILVAEDAQKTDGYQLSRTMVLSDTARSSAKPELEIYADDVKCSHGSTTGAIVPDELLYLRSRGIEEQTARQMLISAFVADVFESLENDGYRNAFLSKIKDWGQNRTITAKSIGRNKA